MSASHDFTMYILAGFLYWVSSLTGSSNRWIRSGIPTEAELQAIEEQQHDKAAGRTHRDWHLRHHAWWAGRSVRTGLDCGRIPIAIGLWITVSKAIILFHEDSITPLKGLSTTWDEVFVLGFTEQTIFE